MSQAFPPREQKFFPQQAAVQRAVGGNHLWSEVADNGLERRGTGLDHLTGDNIGIDNLNPKLREGVGDRTFTAADPAC